MLIALLAAMAVFADDGVDQDLLMIGSDDALLAVPEPWIPSELVLPDFDAESPDFMFSPPFLPPIGDWLRLVTDQFPPSLLEFSDFAMPRR